jgi:hypothetical protein
VRTSIVLWSAFSGAVIGTFVDVVLIALALFAGAAAPALAFRLSHRWMGVAAAALLAAIPLALAFVGALEGRLKAD